MEYHIYEYAMLLHVLDLYDNHDDEDDLIEYPIFLVIEQWVVPVVDDDGTILYIIIQTDYIVFYGIG